MGPLLRIVLFPMDTGETPWVAKIIETYHDEAKAKAIRIIPCCGYDSVPSDLGAFFVTEYARKTLGKGLASLRTVVAEFHGGISGGTIDTGMWLICRILHWHV